MINCPNCGAKEFDNQKKNAECEYCGYHLVETRELEAVTLILCEGCGATLSSPCPIHDKNKQKKAKI